MKCAAKWIGVLAVLGFLQTAQAQSSFATVTQVIGAPQIVGQAVQPLQTIAAGSLVETGESDAMGVLTGDVVVQMSAGTRLTLREEADAIRIQLEHGLVAYYLDSASRRVIVETPFGVQTSTSKAGWYTTRHERQRPNISSATSVFAVVEGGSDAVGTNPVTPVHPLTGGQRWIITDGVAPGAPVQADTRAEAIQLRDSLSLASANALGLDQPRVDLLLNETPSIIATGLGPQSVQVMQPDFQGVVGVNDVSNTFTPVAPIIPPPTIDNTDLQAGGIRILRVISRR